MVETQSQKDIITEAPVNVMFVEHNLIPLFEEFQSLLNELKLRPMSAKDMYDHYESQLERKGLKTIYRYIERLENAGLIIVTGQRITEGNRTLEKLYARAAKVFFIQDYPDEQKWWETDAIHDFTEAMNKLLSSYFKINSFDDNDLREAVKLFFKHQDTIANDIVSLVKTDPRINDTYAEKEALQINKLNMFAGIIGMCIQYPGIFDKIREQITK